jgi:hypothetical protein
LRAKTGELFGVSESAHRTTNAFVEIKDDDFRRTVRDDVPFLKISDTDTDCITVTDEGETLSVSPLCDKFALEVEWTRLSRPFFAGNKLN